MAEAAKTLTLSEEYLLKEKEEKLDAGAKPAEESEAKSPVSATSEEVASSITEEVVGGSNEVNSASADESSGESSPAIAESNGTSGSAGGSDIEATEAAAEESSGNAEQEDSGDQEGEETPEIKLETAPADFRFPTTNQSRHCFTRYIEYHRCVAAKGEGAPECDKFAKYYRSLCPGEWVDRWNEQRENGTFPGPL
jgi:cytochrome c oxidase subunit 6b